MENGIITDSEIVLIIVIFMSKKTYSMEEILAATAQDIEEQVSILRQNLKRKKSHAPLEYV